MDKNIAALAPHEVWKQFAALCAIPRPSGHETAVRDYLIAQGNSFGIECFADEAGNVIMRKPATPGMKDRKGIILQAHMDMVPQKNNDKTFDFTKDPIEAYIDGKTEERPLATRENIGRTIDFAAGRNRYIGYLISLPTRSFKNIRVGLDCSNGSSSAIAKSVFDALGAKTYVINNEPDGTNINTNCGSTHIEVLQKFVKEQGLDVGFAYDGDADRCIAVDENGEVVDGDRILYVCGKYMMEQGALKDNTIVTTVMSNLGLYKACDQVGMRYEKTAVGDKYVYENMVKNGYQLGGEQSGHIIFSKHATTGDGILTSLKIMEVMLEKKASLGTLAGEVKIYPQLLQNLRVQDMDATLNHPDVQKAIKEVEDRLGTEGRVLVRKSGTEPLLRVMVEALSDELCEESVLHIINAMKSV